MADRRQKREIRQLEQELHKWQVLVDSITGEGPEGGLSGILCSPEHLPWPVWAVHSACSLSSLPCLGRALLTLLS